MKNKRFVTGFAVLAFSALVLGACGADDNGSSNSSSSSEASTAQTSESATTESSAKVVAGGELKMAHINWKKKITLMATAQFLKWS